MFHKHLIYEQQVTNSLIREHTPKPFVTLKSTRNQSLFEKIKESVPEILGGGRSGSQLKI